MTVYQLPVPVATFRHWLTELVRRVPSGGGWYGVFAERDPEGLRACFDGTEILPWDIVESLLQDAGEPGGGPLALRGRALYAAATGAHDRRPGGAQALAERRELMERERRYAESRARALGDRLRATPAPGPDDTARLEHDLAWTRDDHARATARVTDLTARLARLGGAPPAAPPVPPPAPPASPAGLASVPPASVVGPAAASPGPAAGPLAASPTQAAGSPPASPAPAAGLAAASPSTPAAPAPPRGETPARAARAGRRPRGARYAWLDDTAEDQGPVAAPTPVPALPALPTGGATPRGARFGGARPAASAGRGGPGSAAGAEGAVHSGADSAEAARAAANAVYALQRLRAQGRSGEAHALLCEALGGPLSRLPALAGELRRAGLGADWSVLLWEAASLPPARLAAVAGVLADAGRAADCEQLLRQGVARPVEELAGACAALRAEGHHGEARALLTAFVRVRTPEDAARLAAEDPRGLVPQLVEAARAVSARREGDLLHALRVAGLAGA
ncbi:UL36 very large tegument protein [Streptomyces sp. NPDC018038]|uniref:UL36 very large tegument protein n=1 Tax=Streptomyces sp. NPDC018038 TaxID=3365036 RepID=UPI0037874AE5